MLTEKELQTDIRKKLKFLERQGSIKWWERLNSGKVQKGSYWIQLCRKGTPDFLVLLKNKKGSLSAIFLELKRPDGKGKLSAEQEEFIRKHHEGDVHCFEIDSVSIMMKHIMSVGWDDVAELDF